VIDAASLEVEHHPTQPLGPRLQSQGENALLGFPLDPFGVDLGGGGEDRQRCGQALTELTIQVHARRDVEGERKRE
jgi:hypothetical protein